MSGEEVARPAVGQFGETVQRGAASLPGPWAIDVHGVGRVFRKMSEHGRRRWWGGLLHRGLQGARSLEQVVALEDVTLRVAPGEIFGLLGPNGAGKTTLIKILSTILLPTSGEARVLGYDVVTQPVQVRERIGMVSGGEVSGYGILTVRENLWLFSQLYGLPSRQVSGRIDELLRAFGLWEYRDTKMNRLSTGYRQRLNVARGFVSDPDVLFLDEPTLGLDVDVARAIRAFVRGWVGSRPGRTVLLTTHYMLEADELCDRVAVINQGRIVACDEPARLKKLLGTDVALVLRTTRPEQDRPLQPLLDGRPEVQKASIWQHSTDGTLEIRILLGSETGVGPVLGALESVGAKVLELHKPEPTLEDVFLKLVGRRLSDDGAAQGGGEGVA